MTTMGKEASLDGLEFDGDTVLCRVCGDKASGFHYGVHACEGCKGFFRRSIQQKIQYRPCLKNQQCNIMRVNRNRCQYCRLKKCIAVGMSRDAVRFGRVPKKEKARIIEQMQKVNSQSHATQLASVLQNTPDLIQAVIAAHRQTCTYTLEHIQHMREAALQKNEFVDCPAHMACPLNANLAVDDNSQVWDDFSEYFTIAIKSVVDFAKSTPGFCLLSQDDQVTLLKAATFEVLLVRMACLFDPDTNTMLFTSGKLFQRQSSALSGSAGFLLDSMFDFAERFNKLGLTDDELALFSAVVLLSPDRPGLRNIEQVEKIQNKLTESLQTVVSTNHADDNTLFAKILMKTTDLRTLNTLHSEKSIGQNSPNGVESLVSDNSESKMEMQHRFGDSRSEGSSPSETSSVCTIGSSFDSMSHDGIGAPIFPQRVAKDTSSHQQVVLKTPYGTFYREEPYGFYGLVPDQTPRRRCHTLDRETMSRPRLHTIEEGNRRRNTLDRDYLNKMVNKLSDKLEKRAAIRGDSMPPSICSSAASSPIPEEYQAYLNSTQFIPISAADSTCSSRASPAINRDSLLPYGSSPSSPNPRSRSGSIGAEDYGQMRPRCYSFHMTGEGRASRAPISMQQLSANRSMERDRISQDDFQPYQLMPEMRRGSVGASYGLHHKKKSLLVDRHPAYLSKLSDVMMKRGDNHGMPLVSEPKMTKIGAGESAFESFSAIRIPVPSRAEQQQLAWNAPSTAPHTVSREQDMPEAQIKQEKNENEAEFMSVEQPMSPMAVDDMPQVTGASSNHVSPSSSPPVEVFHKKFDKLRKHIISNSDKTDKEEYEMKCRSDVENSDKNVSLSPNSENDVKLVESNKLEDKPKLTAVDKHPQLLAHLKAPNPNVQYRHFFPTMNQGPGFSNQQQQQQQSPKMTYEPKDNQAPLNVPKGPFVNSAPNQEMNLANGMLEHRDIVHGDKREQLHAATVSHLKDKLLRKYDSMENLSKIGQNQNPDDNNPNKIPVVQGKFDPHINRTQVQAYPIPPVVAGMSGGQIPANLFPPGIYQPGLPLHPAFATYSSMQTMNVLPATYNQHLAGMQQLAQFYGNTSSQFPQKMVGPEGQPLNLSRPPATNGNLDDDRESQYLSFEQILDRKIKEEISS